MKSQEIEHQGSRVSRTEIVRNIGIDIRMGIDKNYTYRDELLYEVLLLVRGGCTPLSARARA
jgi:hypothetical protein